MGYSFCPEDTQFGPEIEILEQDEDRAECAHRLMDNASKVGYITSYVCAGSGLREA